MRELLELHAVARPQVLDCTYGTGAIWGRLPIRRELIKADINPALPGLDFACDWRDLPHHVRAIDVLVWDPIQVSDVGHNSQLYQRYVAAEHPVRGPGGVLGLFADFFDMATAIVRPRTGIVLAKMCDQVHSGRYQWQVFALVAEGQARGWTACQPRVLFNPAPMPIPGTRLQRHTRNDVAYWIVLRNGPACHGPGRLVRHERTCTGCGTSFASRRRDALTCSARCRWRVLRKKAPG